MFGIGGPELVLIVIVALLFVGPDKLPLVARSVGTGLRDLRRAANLAQAELRETLDNLAREVESPPTPAPQLSQTQLDARQAAEDRAAARTAEIANAAPHTGSAAATVQGDEPVPEPVFDGPPTDGETFAVIPRRTAQGQPDAPVPTVAEPGLAEALAEAVPPGTRSRNSSPVRAGSLAAEAASSGQVAATVTAGLTSAPQPVAADPEQDA